MNSLDFHPDFQGFIFGRDIYIGVDSGVNIREYPDMPFIFGNVIMLTHFENGCIPQNKRVDFNGKISSHGKTP